MVWRKCTNMLDMSLGSLRIAIIFIMVTILLNSFYYRLTGDTRFNTPIKWLVYLASILSLVLVFVAVLNRL